MLGCPAPTSPSPEGDGDRRPFPSPSLCVFTQDIAIPSGRAMLMAYLSTLKDSTLRAYERYLGMVTDLCASRMETSKTTPEQVKALFFRSVGLTSFMKYFSDFSISCWRGPVAWSWLIQPEADSGANILPRLARRI